MSAILLFGPTSAYGLDPTINPGRSRTTPAMSSASPSNSMNPFALTDEEEDTSFPSSSTNLRSSYQGHRKGLTSGSDPHPDGLPSRIGSATTAPDRKSAEDDDVGMSGKNPAESYDDNEPPESLLFGLAADSCADISPGRLPNSRSIVDDSTPADSDIPTIDPESRAATAEQSMYMSYRPSSSANSQPVQSSSTSTVRSDTKKGANLGSSSTSTSHDFSRRTGQQQGIGKPAMDRKGKGKAQLNNSTETLLNLVSSDVRDKADRGRISDVNHPVHNVAPSRANSASPPPDLLISPSSVSSIGLSTKPHHSIPRDAAAEKRNLLPLPVTTPHTIAGNRMEGSSMVGHVLGSSSTGDVIFDANGEHRKEKKRSSTKSRTERHHHRHSKRHHKHSRAMEYEDNDREEDGEQYSNDDAGGYDQRTMIMSSLSNRNESRTGKHKRSRKRVDPTAGLSEREKALWVWANVTDLDGYLQEVYIPSPMTEV
ncbi:hypothetical protein QFC22_004680 [Naganishia vaughanmartiniae]|uniref:Uncharacterized protein n=1 Tax=Naganishia vaughanmartiniae TaxID=1424756 RepID=A0ACC2WZF4_9TREE|nr:hypothetical protein QFC22_004680 [Naganishia vaughanmartiniae]